MLRKYLFLLLLCSLARAQDPFYRNNISTERMNANRSYTVKISTDSIAPSSGFAKIWMKDTNFVYLILPSGRRINLKDAGSITGGAGSGTVTSVSSANGDITVATGTTTPVLTLNSGTGANKILKLNVAGQIPAIDGSLLTNLITTSISEGSNLYYTDARARNAVSGSGLILYNSTTGQFSIAGQSITNFYVLDGTLTDGKIATGQVVKSINGLHDFIKFAGEGGASVRTSNDTLYINAGSGGGGGGSITSIQSTDGSLTVSSPAGPTTTINVATNGIDSNKIASGMVTNSDIKDGTIITADFNASAKAPLATLADSAVPRGLATGDLSGGYPNPVVGAQKITASKILNNTITRTQVATTFKAPFADTSDGLSATYYLLGNTTVLANTDSITITDARLTTNSSAWLNVQGYYPSGYLATIPSFIPHAGYAGIKFFKETPTVNVRVNYQIKF